MWLAMITRPDITFCTNHLAQYLVNPTKDHVDAALDILRYLNSTIRRGMCLTGGTDNDLDLRCFVDAAFTDDRMDRKPSSGYVFKLAGGPISWKSGKCCELAPHIPEDSIDPHGPTWTLEVT
jgi:hypothetical protein